MNDNTFYRLRDKFRKQFGLTTFRALLGDVNRVLDEPGKPGYVRVRYTQAAGLSQPTTVRFRAAIPKIIDAPVIIGYDRENELAVIDADFAAQLAGGMNPLGNQATDPNVTRFVNQSQITTLLSTPISSASDSMLVTVQPFLYILNGTLHYFRGGDGADVPIDLTSSRPGSANQQCVAVLLLDPADDTVEIQVSTAIDIGDDVGTADVQECLNNSTPGTIPIWAWRLYNGQTGIADGTPANGGDNFLDLRVMIYFYPTPYFGRSTIITLASDVAAAGNKRHVVLAAETGTSDNCIEITGLSVGEEMIVRADAGDTITLKHNDAGATDKIILYQAADFALSSDKTIKLCKIASGKVVQYVDQV